MIYLKNNEPLDKPGLYKIVNIINGKCYVGVSKNLQRRAKNHSLHAIGRLRLAFAKHGQENFIFEPVIYALSEDLDTARDWLWDLEIDLITELDTIKNGYNIYEGFKGPRILDSSYLGKISEIRKKLWEDPEYRAKASESQRKGWTSQARKRRSILSKELWSDPEKRKKLDIIHNSPEWRDKQSKRVKLLYNNSSEYREKHQASINTPEYKAKISKASKERWSDPAFKAKVSKIQKERWAERRILKSGVRVRLYD